MPQLSRDPLQRTHRPAGCEWLSRYAFGRDGCHRPAGRGVSSPLSSLYSTAVLRGITHPRRALARTPYLQPAASSSGPRTVWDWTPYHLPFLGTVQRARSAPTLQAQRPFLGSPYALEPGFGTHFWGGAPSVGRMGHIRTRTDTPRHCPSHSFARRTLMHGLATPRCASPETGTQ